MTPFSFASKISTYFCDKNLSKKKKKKKKNGQVPKLAWKASAKGDYRGEKIKVFYFKSLFLGLLFYYRTGQ